MYFLVHLIYNIYTDSHNWSKTWNCALELVLPLMFGYDLQQAMDSYNLSRDEVLRIVKHNLQLKVFESNPRYTLEEIRNMCGL